MTTEQFEAKQAAMSNDELIELALNQVKQLAKTGGKSHKMCIPPMVTDTDMIFGELIRRFKKSVTIQSAYNVKVLLFDFWHHIRMHGDNTPKKEIKEGIADFLANYKR